MTQPRVHLTVDDARALAEDSLRRIGYAAEDAAILADHMIDAALCGYEYSGLPKILNIPEHPRFARPRSKMSILRQTPVSTLWDGGNENGMLTLYHAVEDAIAKAATQGFALVGVTNTWMSGRSAYYVERIARADLVGIHTVSASRAVAPHGGTRPVFGTNPIAFGLPTSAGPLVFDMGTSAFMVTELMLRERLGEELPPGVALDSAGKPTRDPAAARQGAVLPFGGHKGYGLAFMMHALGILAGSALDPEKDNGYLFIVMRPDLLVPADELKEELTRLVERVKATPRQEGVAEIRIPSERSFANRERNLRQGIEIDRLVYDALRAL
jgi:LDH2 family malate/lactate/ureidoglycolate dehydrogenase